MNLIFVNYCSPSISHVSGIRLWNLGRALAHRGHRVLVITSDDGNGERRASGPGHLRDDLRAHDWREPFLLEIPEPAVKWLQRVREGKAPRVVRAAGILWAFLVCGGMFYPWRREVRHYQAVLRSHFEPDCVWATMGNTDTLDVGRALADYAGCAVGFDVKDPWINVIPRPLRSLLKGRFDGADFYTANGALQAEWAARWFGSEYEVVYSGFWKGELAANGRPQGNTLRLQFFGSFDLDKLRMFAGWMNELLRSGWNSPLSIEFSYAGACHAKFASGTQSLRERGIAITVEDYLPFEQLVKRCRAASANAYFCSEERNPIHHKAIELLAHQRPVIVSPLERAEVREIYRACALPLLEVDGVASLRRALEAVAKGDGGLASRDEAERYTWERQAEMLERIIGRAAQGRAGAAGERTKKMRALVPRAETKGMSS